MRNLTALSLTLLALIVIPDGTAQVARNKSKAGSKIPSQAMPAFNLLKAVQNDDFDLYASVWSSKELKRRPLDRQTWKATREKEMNSFRDLLGTYNPNDVKYSFSGNNSKGTIWLARKGADLFSYQVVKEGKAWRIELPTFNVK
jgi:hypothetical protein